MEAEAAAAPAEVEAVVKAVKAVSSVVVKVKVTAALHLSVQHRCGGGGGEGGEGGIVGGGEG